MKRYVIVLSALELGGAERQAMHFACWLKNKGHLVHVLSLSKRSGAAIEICKKNSISYSLINCPWYGNLLKSIILQPLVLIKTLFALRALKADVFLPYCMEPDLTCGLLWKLAGAQGCLWQQRDEGRNRKNRLYEYLAVKFSPKFNSNSIHGADFVEKTLNVSKDKVSVIKNGIKMEPAQKSRAEWRKEYGLSDDTIVYCMTANIHNHKDHLTLIKAWELLNNKIKDSGKKIALLLCGRKEDTYQKMLQMTKELGVNNNIFFTGAVSDVAGVLVASDIFVFSSKKEGLPNAVIEAMTCGLPVLGTDIPGIREAVGKENYTFLSKVDDFENLAEKMYKFCKDELLRKEVGNNNKQIARKEFSIEKMCSLTYDLIESL